MNSSKLMLAGMTIAMSFFSQSWAVACEGSNAGEFDKIVTIIKDKANKNIDTESYAFSTCDSNKLHVSKTEQALQNKMPNDETSLGMYALYREKGESNVEATKHVNAFNAEFN